MRQISRVGTGGVATLHSTRYERCKQESRTGKVDFGPKQKSLFLP